MLNPQGEGQVSFLTTPGVSKPIGFLGVGARWWTVRGSETLAGVLVDFVVHTEHRTAMPALKLQREGRERALLVMGLLLGLPDVKAVAVFKRLGSAFKCDLPRHVRVLHFAGYLRRHIPAWLAYVVAFPIELIDWLVIRARLLLSASSGEWVETFDERFDDLWNRFDKSARSMGVRNRRFLEWRFGQQPGRAYRTFAISRRNSGELQMYFVCEQVGAAITVKDVLGEGSEAELRQGLLLLSCAARQCGAALVSIQVCGDAALAAALRRTQFVIRDSRPFFAMGSSSMPGHLADLSWYITQADEDI